MQNIETAYELKDCTEYLIAAPSEITGSGAPYNTVVPALFIHNDEQMYQTICDNYYTQIDIKGGHLPISVIKTDKLNDLATATKAVLPAVVENLPHDDFGYGHIYYFCLVYRMILLIILFTILFKLNKITFKMKIIFFKIFYYLIHFENILFFLLTILVILINKIIFHTFKVFFINTINLIWKVYIITNLSKHISIFHCSML